jgi:uncharacterized surface protein with fasciclin (FAS1) repeats
VDVKRSLRNGTSGRFRKFFGIFFDFNRKRLNTLNERFERFQNGAYEYAGTEYFSFQEFVMVRYFTSGKAFLAAAMVACSMAGFACISSTSAMAGDKAMAPASKDIVDTAAGAGKFNTLVAAVKAAGLVDTLKGAGPFTVFAPTDDAFAKLPAGTVENLLKPENKEKLVAILTYHVVAGKVEAADVVKMTEAKTVQGQSVTIKASGGKVMVDGAQVVKTDIGTSNGVIHVIDTVIMPK